MLRFAYSTLNWGETYPLGDMFAEIHQANWQAVEMFAQPLNWLGPVAHCRRRLEQANLTAATFFGSVSLPTDKQQLTLHQRRIDYAAELGAEAYGLVGGSRLRWRPPNADEYKDLARFCEALAVYGADQGVVVAYHPHVACTVETEEEIDTLMAQTQHLKLCLDVSHVALVEEDPLKHLEKYCDRLGYLHLKDWGKGKFVELGKGSLGIDLPAFLKYLDAQQYPGWVVVEQSRSDVSPLHSAQINADYLRSLGYSLGVNT